MHRPRISAPRLACRGASALAVVAALALVLGGCAGARGFARRDAPADSSGVAADQGAAPSDPDGPIVERDATGAAPAPSVAATASAPVAPDAGARPVGPAPVGRERIEVSSLPTPWPVLSVRYDSQVGADLDAGVIYKPYRDDFHAPDALASHFGLCATGEFGRNASGFGVGIAADTVAVFDHSRPRRTWHFPDAVGLGTARLEYVHLMGRHGRDFLGHGRSVDGVRLSLSGDLIIPPCPLPSLAVTVLRDRVTGRATVAFGIGAGF